MTLLVGVMLLLLCAAALHGRYREWSGERKMKQAEALAKCMDAGHEWGPIENALDSPWFPFRRCQRCGLQEHLKRCTACGRCVNGGRLCGEDERS